MMKKLIVCGILFGVLPVALIKADISATDKAINENVLRYTPVYANQSTITIEAADPLKGGNLGELIGDFLDKSQDTLHVGLVLENAVRATPAPWPKVGSTFLGYSDSQSYLQVYISKGGLLGSKMPIGELIPLKEGSYTVQFTHSSAKDSSIFYQARYNTVMNVRVEKSTMPLETTESGNFWNSYKDVNIYYVRFTAVKL